MSTKPGTQSQETIQVSALAAGSDLGAASSAWVTYPLHVRAREAYSVLQQHRTAGHYNFMKAYAPTDKLEPWRKG